jgi:cytochrome c oxidase assembly protein subunit 11
MTRNARTVWLSLAGMAVMIALVVASVPLYRLFCKVTGYGGTTRVAVTAPEEGGASGAQAGERETITVRFDANVVKDVPWRFVPEQGSMTVRLGETGLALFSAQNLSDQPVIGQATYNVVPDKVGRYFNKIECFCFTEQRLEPGQRVEMPVQFFVDPALAGDPGTAEVTTITLSYTFFRAPTLSHRGPS